METNWDDLRNVPGAGARGHPGKTAKALDVSHPTVSRRVQALEHTIGAPIRAPACYLGDQDPALRRFGGVLAEVSTEQWLLVHRDLRALPRVRAVMDALVQLFQRHRSLLEGRGRQTAL